MGFFGTQVVRYVYIRVCGMPLWVIINSGWGGYGFLARRCFVQDQFNGGRHLLAEVAALCFGFSFCPLCAYIVGTAWIAG
jgi:hypothetical protein